MSMDPGLDLHDWETEWQALEPLVRDSPEEALPELQRLVERMLDERGLAVDDVVTAEGIDPEVVADYDASRDLRGEWTPARPSTPATLPQP